MVLKILCLACSIGRAAEPDPRAAMNERHRAFLNEHCLKCHGAQKPKGKFRVDDLPLSVTTIESVERWKKVLDAVNSGAMPPEEEKQPSREAKADFLAELSRILVSARRALADTHGEITMRRLNRREYRNTLRELLGVEIDVGELPADTLSGGFDTLATNLFLSSDQVEQYLALGREAVAEAFDRRAHAGARKVERFEAEQAVERVRATLQDRIDCRRRYILWSKAVDDAAARPENQLAAREIRVGMTKEPPWNFYHWWKKLVGAPSPTEFGFVDGETATHMGIGAWNLVPYQTYFLVQPELKTGAFLTVGDNGVNPFFTFAIGYDWPPGEYVVRIRAAATRAATPERRFLEFGVSMTHLSTHEVLGTMESPRNIEIPFTLTKNRDRSFFVRERGTFDSNEQGIRKQGLGAQRNGIGPEFAIWVDWAEVERIPAADARLAPGIEALQIPVSATAKDIGKKEIRGAIERFAVEACRGNALSPAFLDRLVAIYEGRRNLGTPHRSALEETLAVVLASPRFLYLTEDSNETPGGALSGIELATRLSYFLWGAPPDPILRDLANRGELSKPAVLEAQTNRLIDDPRSAGFIVPFAHQWLGLDRLDFFRFNNARYTAFDESTKMAARAEVYETVGQWLRRNASLKNLLKSDFVVINSLLANYYGLDGVVGDTYRAVSVPKGSPRGGFLGMAAILAMGSNGEETSPVERGAWVLRKLLSDPPPPAPANVPQLSRLAGKPLTTRERLRAHQEAPQCASCHRAIDPIGLGLENFNAVGQWRTEDSHDIDGGSKKRWAIDPSGALHNGPAFGDYFALREIIAARSDAFARGFAGALIEYCLGRPRGESDEPLILEMVNQSREKDLAIREFIHVLVRSKEFHTK
jgi:hypothetical protein